MISAHSQSNQHLAMVEKTASQRQDAAAGTAYLLLAAIAALVGGGVSVLAGMGMLPAAGLWGRLAQAHPALMLLYVVVPALVSGFGTLWLPRALGRQSMLLGRLNLLAVGVLGVAAVLTCTLADARLAHVLWSLGALMSAVVLLSTIFDSCADSLEQTSFSPFVWGEMLSSTVLLLCAPVFAAATLRAWLWPATNAMVGAEYFAVPVGLIVLLAGFGIVFEMAASIGQVQTRPVAYIMAATAASGVVAWAKSSLAHGADSLTAQMVGNVLLALCSLSAVCLAGLWLAGTWKARVSLRTPLLWGMGFLAVVAGGWVVQLVQGTGLHPALQLGALYAVCGGFYLWRGEACGFWYPQKLARLHFVLTAVATLCLFVSGMQVLGCALFGMAALVFVLAAFISFQRDIPVPAGTLAVAQADAAGGAAA
ncbi:cytochrome C oxidase subunit I [Acetobacter lambici]|uniref:Cbb3-type cytochrome c oxidase subunit I n=1 Tax=Acetobacter lambici TaxID=1332824 RepID=A0ABT1EX73_9PROT|nr:cbb3-type cytochrome c oxidase subunit I [Acetobacter lambici]MCP1241438.1 cbb3-type cytochrome c oxidase subunit I [Acetobacter lambici]MCP1257562.1 cbb3-type cytochrome c oxidase subunit I [Acetobacter lambici]NHO55943.1 cytochrome C oxidase subunit I [Acetobacter lambici]